MPVERDFFHKESVAEMHELDFEEF